MKDLSQSPDTIEWAGVTFRTILDTTATAGCMSIVEIVAPPQFSPPRHVQHGEDETFVVLSGEIEVWLEGALRIVGPGQSAFVPRGREHSFRVLGNRPCRHLVILTPGGFEGFFADMAAGQFRIPEDMPEILESGARHQMDFTGPPLGAA